MAETIEIRKGFKIGFDELIERFSDLNTTELNTFLRKLNQATEQQQHSKQEEMLLTQIKEIIPASIVRRFKQLQAKQHDNTISEKETTEIILLTDFMEEKSAERVALLADLAKIRGVSITDLAKELRLKKYYG
jgi:hypothetical protein